MNNAKIEFVWVHTVQVGAENPDEEGGGYSFTDSYHTTDLQKAKTYKERNLPAKIFSNQRNVIRSMENGIETNLFNWFKSSQMKIFLPQFSFEEVLYKTKEHGYCFTNLVNPEACFLMKEEAKKLDLRFADHVIRPLNRATAQQVKQSHERAYRALDAVDIPVASNVCRQLANDSKSVLKAFPELVNWMPTEIGYQRYRDERDWISPHRDRASDQLLSVTFTITGSAYIKIHESCVDPPNYTQLKQIDEFLTKPNTVMFLRAPGFGSGKQIIHEVMPPIGGPRMIVNLRMRTTILKTPEEFEKDYK